jgi:hypothetical protein
MTPQPTQPGQEGQERVWVRAVDGRPDRLLPTLVLSSYCPGPPENWIEVIPPPRPRSSGAGLAGGGP